MIGRTLAHYRIQSKLGAGGMGEVFCAEDTRLGRKVAVKVLPGDFVQEPSRFERFQREARVVAALNLSDSLTSIYTQTDIIEHDPQSGVSRELIQNAAYPAYSPDGNWIAYSQPTSDGGLDARIWIADANGRNRRQLSRDTSEEFAHVEPAWSRDSQFIAFNSNRNGEVNLFAADLAAGTVRQITQGRGGDFQPSWSPDGQWITFDRTKQEGADLYLQSGIED